MENFLIKNVIHKQNIRFAIDFFIGLENFCIFSTFYV